MEGPNPLRPYYIPPSIGSPPDILPSKASTANISSKHGLPTSASTSSFGSSARNILAEMDYSEYLSESSSSAGSSIRDLLEQAIWKYTSVFIAQPFEVAKIILQVHVPSSEQNPIAQAYADDNRSKSRIHRAESTEVNSDIIKMGKDQPD